MLKESKDDGEKEGFRGRDEGVKKQGPIHHMSGEDTFQCPYSERIHSLKVTIVGWGGGSGEKLGGASVKAQPFP